MSDEAGTRKIRQTDLTGAQEEGDLTGEEIEKLADLFATALQDEEKEEDTGPFEAVRSDDDTGPFKPVTD